MVERGIDLVFVLRYTVALQVEEHTLMPSNTNKIVSVSGLISSGKDTIADFLVTNHGFKRISFASSLKDAIANIFGWDRAMLEGRTKSSRAWREQVDEWWTTRLNMPHLTPRWVMQYWGTEVCRCGFHDDIWIASVEHKLLSVEDNVVITDSRFINELNAIKRAGGISLRVNRGNNPSWYQYAVSVNRQEGDWEESKKRLQLLNIHASEYSSVGLDYDVVIENNSTIDDLHRKVALAINL